MGFLLTNTIVALTTANADKAKNKISIILIINYACTPLASAKAFASVKGFGINKSGLP